MRRFEHEFNRDFTRIFIIEQEAMTKVARTSERRPLIPE